jgi:transcriptional regulator with XRE-family HTH domain
MLSFRTPARIAFDLAKRIRERRLARGWSQAELAARAGLKAPTYVLFERTGRIALLRLLKLLEILDLVGEFDRIGRTKDLTGLTLDDLTRPERKRGRSSRS